MAKLTDTGKKSGSSTVDKILGSISPLYGLASGAGAFGNMGNVLKHGVLGSALRSGSYDDEEEDLAAVTNKPTKLAKGGKVKCKRDGCAARGKTKGKMR